MTGYAWWPLGVCTCVLGIITVATTFITPETRARDLTLIEDAPLARTKRHLATA